MEIAALVSANISAGFDGPSAASEDTLQRGWMAIRGLQRSWGVSLTEGAAERVPQPIHQVVARGATQPHATSTPRDAGISGEIPPTSLAGPTLRFAARRFFPSTGDSRTGETRPTNAPVEPRVTRTHAVSENLSQTVFPINSWQESAAEVCVAEPAIRAWCCVSLLGTSGDPRKRQEFARHVGDAQNQLRHQLLSRLSAHRGNDAGLAVLDRLRRTGERWSDLFVGSTGNIDTVSRLAIDPERAYDLATRHRCGNPRLRRSAWELTLASLRTVYPAFPWSTEPRSRLACGLGESFAGMLSADDFDDFGTIIPAWMRNLDRQRQH